MDNPNIKTDLQRIDHAEGIIAKRQGDLEHARTETMHWLGNIGLAALSRDRQGGKRDRPNIFREGFELLQRRFDPRDRPCLTSHLIRPYSICHVVIFDNSLVRRLLRGLSGPFQVAPCPPWLLWNEKLQHIRLLVVIALA